MKSKFLITFIALHFSLQLFSQQVPYKIETSEGIDIPGYTNLTTLPYGPHTIIQVNSRGTESFKFFSYSSDLKLVKENTVNFDKASEIGKAYHPFLIKLKSKSYLFMRNIDREKQLDGISALEFSPANLNFVGTAKRLYTAERIGANPLDYRLLGNPMLRRYELGPHSAYVCGDSTKMLFVYMPKKTELRDKLNFEKIGLQVFDEQMQKMWGGEYTIPHSEYDMDKESYFLSNSGRVYLVARVYTSQKHEFMTNTDVKTFYYELIIFEKDNPKPKKVRIKVDNAGIFRFNLMEGIGNEIYLTGTTSQPYEAPFMAQYNETTDELIATSFVFFRRPLELLKLYRSEGERNKIDRMEKGIDKGNREWYESNLEVRKLFFAPNGSTKIITEVDYFSGAGAYSRSNDIYVLSISSDHKLEWMRKLPKAQKNQDFSLPVPAADLSMNAYITGNDLHIFYLDNPANFNLAETSVPEICKEGKSNNLIGVHIDVNGNVKKYDLGNTDQFESDFFIKNFIDGGNRNLIYTQQKRKKNTVFSIHIIE